MDMTILNNIKEKNEKLKSMKAAATPGPWYVQENDDNQSMNLIAITTCSIPQSFRSNNYDSSAVIALTLVQSPRYASIGDGRWDENAELIAHMYNSNIEEDMDLLIAEVMRLKSLK